MTKQMAESLGMNDLDRVKKALEILKEKEDEQPEDVLEDPSDDASEDTFDQSLVNFAELNLQEFEDPVFDQEMDEIAEDARRASEELFDLGMNVETKLTAEIASAAERFKNTQLAAKKAKADRKLKMMDLKLKERRLDLLEEKQNATLSQGTIDGEGDFIGDDRDSILDD